MSILLYLQYKMNRESFIILYLIEATGQKKDHDVGAPGEKQGLCLVLTVRRYPIGLCWRWVSCVGGGLLDPRTVLCLAVGCHGRGRLAGQETWARSAWKERRLSLQAPAGIPSPLFRYQHHHFPLGIYSFQGRCNLRVHQTPFYFLSSWALQ